MRTVPSTSSAPHRKKVQRATAALGLICALTAGSCWAQPTAKAGEGAGNAAAQASASKDSKGKQSAKSSSKTTKVAKSAQTKQDSGKSKTSGKSADKSADKTVAAKADKPDASAVAQKSVVDAKAPTQSNDKVQARTSDLTPPPGTMMGAYGQSLQQQAAAATQPRGIDEHDLRARLFRVRDGLEGDGCRVLAFLLGANDRGSPAFCPRRELVEGMAAALGMRRVVVPPSATARKRRRASAVGQGDDAEVAMC